MGLVAPGAPGTGLARDPRGDLGQRVAGIGAPAAVSSVARELYGPHALVSLKGIAQPGGIVV